MEQYFEKPILPRIFYYKNSREFLCYHNHDIDLTVSSHRYIYMYRDPVSTIYSQMKYYKEDMNNSYRVRYWVNLYGLHLTKWLIDNYTDKSIIINYDKMKKDPNDEFRKVCDFFNIDFDRNKFHDIYKFTTKDKLNSSKISDDQVVNITDEYVEEKKLFIKRYEQVIVELLFNFNCELKGFFL